MAGIDQDFLNEIRSRTSLSGVIGARTKLSRSGRNWKACCPFHGEKTPSFYVYDDHFHCFGCGKHGDVVTFVMENQNLSFVEAVEKLAGEAGLKMPSFSPEQAAQNQQRVEQKKTAENGLQIALDYYCKQLRTEQGKPVRQYLAKRGITPDVAQKFGLGWAPKGGDLLKLLQEEKVSYQSAVDAGIIRASEEEAATGVLEKARLFFFERLMIPIFDPRGKIVSFGGRALGDALPKYINGPETPLFHKKYNLFNFFRARQSSRARTHLLVVEGYLDVIALDQYGIDSAVAPLGTAVGEEQLQLLWRVSDTPIFCLDGDKAGVSAAKRVCDRALEIIQVGQTVNFCFLPAGEDPDTFIREKGRDAFERLLEHPVTLADAAYNLLMSSVIPDPKNSTPDQRAEFKKELNALAQKISDKNLGFEYRSEWLKRYSGEFHSSPVVQGGFSSKGKYPRRGAVISLNKVSPGAMQRLKLLTALILSNPEIFGEVESTYWDIDLPEKLDDIRRIIGEAALQGDWSIEQLKQVFEQEGVSGEVGRLLSLGKQFAKNATTPTALEQWNDTYSFLNLDKQIAELQSQIKQAFKDKDAELLEELTHRMKRYKAQARGEPLEE